jgi:hypothetical protein
VSALADVLLDSVAGAGASGAGASGAGAPVKKNEAGRGEDVSMLAVGERN